MARVLAHIDSKSAVTIIPFTLLWNTRIHTPKKLAIAGLFSLTVVTIALAIARAIVINVTKKANGLQDPSYVWMWGTIQASIGRSPDHFMKALAFTAKPMQQLSLYRASRHSPSFSRRLLVTSNLSGRRRPVITSD